MGQFIVKEKNKDIKNTFLQLEEDGYLKVNFSLEEIKRMFNTFGNLEQYLTQNVK